MHGPSAHARARPSRRIVSEGRASAGPSAHARARRESACQGWPVGFGPSAHARARRYKAPVGHLTHAVHPRTRGHDDEQAVCGNACLRSIRARAGTTKLVVGDVDVLTRSIRARAGTTRRGSGPARICTVHPRTRGHDPDPFARIRRWTGPSAHARARPGQPKRFAHRHAVHPRTRGHDVAADVASADLRRSIRARAGTTLRSGALGYPPAVHPRTRGHDATDAGAR